MKKLWRCLMPAVLAAGMSLLAVPPVYAHGHHHGKQGHCEHCADCPHCRKGASRKGGGGQYHCPNCAKAGGAARPEAPAEKPAPQTPPAPEKK